MQLGPTLIYKCPNCEALISNKSIGGGNNFNAKIFSDTKSISLMLAEFPIITKCIKCDTIFWLSKMEPIKKIPLGYNYKKPIKKIPWGYNYKKPSEYQKAIFLTIEDYFRALENGLAENQEDEKYIRIQIWWAYNDRIRINDFTIFLPETIAINKNNKLFTDNNDEMKWRENCEKLISILDPSIEDEKIMIAELYRNLGDFEKCKSIILDIDNDEINWIKERFLKECELKNKLVVLLN
jgi:hypothetical protein